MTDIADMPQAASRPACPYAEPDQPETPRHAHRILIALRDRTLLREACAALESLGMQAVGAASVEEALDAHARAPCALILLDAALASENRFAAVRRLRAVTAQRIPLIACAAGIDEAARNALLRADFDDICAPPLVRTQLNRLLHLWLPVEEGEAGLDDAGAGMRSVAELLGAGFDAIALMFRRDSDARLDALRAGLRDGNAQGLAGVAHALGGSCASIGAWRMAGLCRALEMQCLAGLEGRLPQLMEAIDAEYRRQIRSLDQLHRLPETQGPRQAPAR